MEKLSFGSTHDGRPVDLYVLANKTGFEAVITNYGGTLVSLKAPDRNGKIADVILGYDTIAATRMESRTSAGPSAGTQTA